MTKTMQERPSSVTRTREVPRGSDQHPYPNSVDAPLPTVSIIIPAFNEESTISRCLEAAMNQTVPAHEIIVVDNRSTDRTAAIVQGHAATWRGRRIRLVQQWSVQGLVPTRNAGFAAASGDIFGRIDADTLIDPTWVEHLSRRMLDDRADAVTGPVSYYDLPFPGPSGVVDDIGRRTLRRLGSQYPFLYGSNMAIRAGAWHKISFDTCADPHDQLHEDIDIAVHLQRAGLSAVYDSAMRAGVSARRMDTSATSFRDYTRRFERTYSSHDIDHWYLDVPQLILRGLYWPVHVTRALFPSQAAVLA